ncbi:MAG: hypothetical protein ABI321_08805 [Polyangia bacterium]
MRAASTLSLLLLAACSARQLGTKPVGPGSGVVATGAPGPEATRAAALVTFAFSIGGTVEGLVSTGLVLALEGGDAINIEEDGGFTFTTSIDRGAAYRVKVAAQPDAPAQVCTLAGGTGTMGTASVTSLHVTCAPASTTYGIGGLVSGLHGTLVLSDGPAKVTLAADGVFTFSAPKPAGLAYDVRIAAQPAGQHCAVERGAGIVYGDVEDIGVHCVDASCVNLGWKGGDANWACPQGFRMPTVDELERVSPCIDPADQGRFSSYADIAVSVGGCGCGWNPDFCDEPSIETMRQGRACGDYPQLEVCVVE